MPLRLRPLQARIFGTSRELGTLPTSLHSDVLTTVLALTRDANERGKPIHLSEERAAAVDAALRDGGVFSGGAAELAATVATWRSAQRADGDADGINAYYDAYRAEGYTAALAGPQDTLTRRCAELTGLELGSDGAPPLLLDLGCGSGLSIVPLERRGCKVLGVDLSIEMLRKARAAGSEVVQADISRPLPWRPGLFDAGLSVSALQVRSPSISPELTRSRPLSPALARSVPCDLRRSHLSSPNLETSRTRSVSLQPAS